MAKPKEYELPSEEIQKALIAIVQDFEKEDVSTRQRQIRLYKKMDYYWNGFQRIYWDNVAHDYKSWNSDINSGMSLNEAAYYDKPLNIFRGFGESIIAALSASIPGVVCFPDDADNPLDVTTAKGGDKIAALIFKHNDAPLLWAKALFTYWTQGMMAAYSYTESRKEYGEIEVEDYEDDTEEREVTICPSCGADIVDEDKLIAESLKSDDEDEFAPDDSDAPRDNFGNQGTLCIQCQQLVNPRVEKQTFAVTRLVGVTKKPKSRQKIQVLGGLYVRVPNYAAEQCDLPYLAYCYETSFTAVLRKYKHLRDKLIISGQPVRSSYTSGIGQYERWGRLNVQYLNDQPLNTPTVRNWWLRVEAFEAEPNDQIRKKLEKLYPDGVKVVLINDEFAEACNQNLDDYWTLPKNPLSNYLTFDPLGTLSTSVQEITNDLTSLTLQTIEHGIPISFADTAVLNFDQFQKTESTPGFIYPAKAKSGKSLSDGFFTFSATSLSKEVEPFSSRMFEMGQFTTGAQPSIFGGALPSSARTASQYQQSRNQALERLQIAWKMLNFWWKNIFGKVIPAYIKNMQEDEKSVKKEHGRFLNDFVRIAEMQGTIGSVELEATEHLPQTFGEIRDVLMQLIEMQNPDILQMLGTSDNLGIVQKYLGLSGFKMPGEQSRIKQLNEIYILLQGEPHEIGPNMLEPSIMPDSEVDDHPMEIETCQSWLRSDEGQLTKLENEAGYENVKAHLKIHMEMNSQRMASMAPEGQPNNNPESPSSGGPENG